MNEKERGTIRVVIGDECEYCKEPKYAQPEEVEAIAKIIMDKYRAVFKRLATNGKKPST